MGKEIRPELIDELLKDYKQPEDIQWKVGKWGNHSSLR